MVCLGNICRSPLAQGILEKKISSKHIVDSAGTAAYHIGKKPDSRSVFIAKKYKIDITNQRARQFKKEDFKLFDLIFAMDQSNQKDILSLAENEKEKKKVKLILNEIPNFNLKDIPDPYYGGDDGFELVFEMLNKACSKIIENHIKKQYS